MTVLANTPPVVPSFTIDPASGNAFTTLFTLSAPDATDSDGDLTYVFKYYSPEYKSYISVSPSSSNPTLTSMLPPGAGFTSTLKMMVVVTDIHGASTTLSTAAVVVPIFLDSGDSIVKIQDSLYDGVAHTDMEKISIVNTGVQATSNNTRYEDEDAVYLVETISNLTATLNLTSTDDIDTVMSAIGAVADRTDNVDGEILDVYIDVIDSIDDELGEAKVVGVGLDTNRIVVGGVSKILPDEDVAGNAGGAFDWLLLKLQERVLKDYAPGMGDIIVDTPTLKITSNLYASDEDAALDPLTLPGKNGSKGSGFSVKPAQPCREPPCNIKNPNPSLVGMTIIEEPQKTYYHDFIAPVYGVGVFNPGRGGKSLFNMTIPISISSETEIIALPECVVQGSAGDWSSSNCTTERVLSKGNSNGYFVQCSCETTRESADDEKRHLGASKQEVKDHLSSNIADAFCRASVVLSTRHGFEDLKRNWSIVLLLSIIYVVYFYAVLKGLDTEHKDKNARRDDLGQSEYVEIAVEKMRKNMEMFVFMNDRESDDESVIQGGINMKTGGIDSGERMQELEAFTRRGNVTRAQKTLADRLLSRRSLDKSASFDDENDQEIMKFLSTRELTLDVFKPNARKRQEVIENDLNVEMSNFESRAYRAQEEKLKRMKSNKRQEFWRGMKKEHEMLQVFSRSFRRLPTANSVGSRERLQTEDIENRSPAESDSAQRYVDTRQVSSRMNSRSSNSSLEEEDGGTSAEVEEMHAVHRKATVLLCELLSFLAMAVFFFEHSESLLGKERWNEMNQGSEHTTMLLLENFEEAFLQVFITLPVTISLIHMFKKLDKKETAHALFESRVATNRARLLHGIDQENPVDIRRAIYECEGLLRIAKRKERTGGWRNQKCGDPGTTSWATNGTKSEAVEYTLIVLRKQLENIRRNQKADDLRVLEKMIGAAQKETHKRGLVLSFGRVAAERQNVEDMLLKLAGLDPARQALFLKDRRAMAEMKSTVKKTLYSWFIAEKGGHLPDGVPLSTRLATEFLSVLYIVFLTYYLFAYGVSQGQVTLLMAVASFSIEVLISLLIVSPLFILFTVVFIPFIAASVSTKNVRRAKANYRQKFGRHVGKGVTKAGAAVTRRVSLFVKKAAETLSPGKAKGSAMTGDGIEMATLDLTLNPMADDAKIRKHLGEKQNTASFDDHWRAESTALRSSSAGSCREVLLKEDTVQGGEEEVGDATDWVSHFTADGYEYWENLSTGSTTWTSPWEEDMHDRKGDKWIKCYDRASGYYFYTNVRTNRSSWSERPT
jgi:hypothetical protein